MSIEKASREDPIDVGGAMRPCFRLAPCVLELFYIFFIFMSMRWKISPKLLTLFRAR